VLSRLSSSVHRVEASCACLLRLLKFLKKCLRACVESGLLASAPRSHRKIVLTRRVAWPAIQRFPGSKPWNVGSQHLFPTTESSHEGTKLGHQVLGKMRKRAIGPGRIVFFSAPGRPPLWRGPGPNPGTCSAAVFSRSRKSSVRFKRFGLGSGCRWHRLLHSGAPSECGNSRRPLSNSARKPAAAARRSSDRNPSSGSPADSRSR